MSFEERRESREKEGAWMEREKLLLGVIKELTEQLKEHEGEEYWTVGDEEAVLKAEEVMRLAEHGIYEKLK